MRSRRRRSSRALVVLGLAMLLGCQGSPSSEAEALSEGSSSAGDEALTGEFSLSFGADHFTEELAKVSCEVVESPQGEVFHVTGYSEGAEGADELVLNLRLPGVTVGQPKVYNRRLLPAFYGSVILRDVALRGETFERLELVAGPVPETAESFECSLTTSLTDSWHLRCTDFAPLDWSAPGGRPLAVLEAEFRCF